MMLPKLEKSHGYGLQFFTNHIGHFMLVTGLLEQLKDEGRVVMLSSDGHRRAPVGAIEFGNLSGDKAEVFAAVSPKAVPLARNDPAGSNAKQPRADAEDAALATAW